MSHGLLWFPLLLACAAGLARMAGTAAPKSFRAWAEGSELAKLDGCGGARLKDGELHWSSFESAAFRIRVPLTASSNLWN